jgi:hypothetical protein
MMCQDITTASQVKTALFFKGQNEYHGFNR